MVGREPTPIHRPVTEEDVERALLANIDALLAGDLERAAEQSKFFARHRLMSASVLAKLLIQERLPAPAAGFQMIEALTFGYPESILRQIALNPNAPDMTRFGAHRRLGWSVATTREEEARLRQEFLSTMRDSQAMLVGAALGFLLDWPGGIEVLDEVVRSLAVISSDDRLAVIQRIVEESQGGSIWFLHAMLHVPDPQTQLASLRELARFRSAVSFGAVDRLARTARDDEVRREAEVTAQRLRLRPVDREEAGIQPTSPVAPQVQASAVGISGLQKVRVIYQGEQMPALVVEFIVGDEGLLDARGSLLFMPDLEDFLDDELEDEGLLAEDGDDLDDDDFDDFDIFDEDLDLPVSPFPATVVADTAFGRLLSVDLPVARGIIAAAIERTIASEREVPPTFELWDPFLHERLPPADDEPVRTPALDERDADMARYDNLVGEMLYVHPSFQAWVIPTDLMLEAIQGVPAPNSNRWSLKQFRPLVEKLLGPDDIERMRRALVRQAWLLGVSGETKEQAYALQVAASLAATPMKDIPKHPFIRAVLQRSATLALNPFAGLFQNLPFR